jgi:flagellar biosynthesis protein FlhG
MAVTISVGSGKGGVGKSIVAANLALLLAKSGKQVVLADLDIGGADAHILFGLLHPRLTLTDFIQRRVESLDAVAQSTAHPNLRILPGTGETLATANLAYAKKQRLLRHFRRLEADILLIDIGAGTNYHALDFFLMADHHLAVATPDPTSVLDLYRFIKLAAIRRVLSGFVARGAVSEALSDRDFGSLHEVIEQARAADPNASTSAAATLSTFRPLLILNRLSGGSRVNVLQLKRLLKEYVGGDLELLGEIPDDPAVGRSVRTFLPVVESEPGAPAAVALALAADALRRRLRAPDIAVTGAAPTLAASPQLA